MKLLGKALALLAGLVILALVYLYVVAPQHGYQVALAAERWVAGLEERQVSAGGLEFHYLVGGEGEPLLLLHGFGGDKDNWTRMARYLSGQYRVIAPDLAGFGETSSPAEADYGYAAQVERVRAFVEALGLESVHIAGNSMGGAIAALYAANYPQDTRSLWLLAPAGVTQAPPSDYFQRLAAGEPNIILPATNTEYYAMLEYVMEDVPWIPVPVKYTLAEKAVAARPMLENIFKQISAADIAIAKALAGSQVPTLITWGEDDELLHPAGAQILADAIPGAQLQMLDDTGHLPMVEKPQASAEAFVAFEQGIEQGGTGTAAAPAPAPAEPAPAPAEPAAEAAPAG